jgi:hypothetical protein
MMTSEWVLSPQRFVAKKKKKKKERRKERGKQANKQARMKKKNEVYSD